MFFNFIIVVNLFCMSCFVDLFSSYFTVAKYKTFNNIHKFGLKTVEIFLHSFLMATNETIKYPKHFFKQNVLMVV